MKKQTLLAQQQLIGYSHAAEGYSVTDLIRGMDLTRDEWDEITCDDGLHFPKKIVDEIEEYFLEKE